MSEHVGWGATEKLSDVVEKLDCLQESLMMLERTPGVFLPEDARENGIRLRKYDVDENVEDWERGRIFHENFELRWEKQDGTFSIVYIGGPKCSLPSGINTESLADFDTQDDGYYLWGEKVTADTLELLGRSGDEETANSFLEPQIPRLLSYPVSNRNEKFRVKISVRHYLNRDTGALEFYRFRGLEEA